MYNNRRPSPEIQILEERLEKFPYGISPNPSKEDIERLCLSLLDALGMSNNYISHKTDDSVVYVLNPANIVREDDRQIGGHYFIYSPKEKRPKNRFIIKFRTPDKEDDIIPLEEKVVIDDILSEIETVKEEVRWLYDEQDEKRIRSIRQMLKIGGITGLITGGVSACFPEYDKLTLSILGGSLLLISSSSIVYPPPRTIKKSNMIYGYNAVRVMGEELIENKQYETS